MKGHVEQLSSLHGAELIARYRGWSADHLEYLSYAGIEALREAGTVAVLLPGAYYFLREKQKPPVEALRAANVPTAVGSDLNPGTVAVRVAAAGDESGVRAIRPDTGGGAGRRDMQCRAGVGPWESHGDAPGPAAKRTFWCGMYAPSGRDRFTALGVNPLVERVFRGGLSMFSPDMSVWKGRVDTADGPEALRWHNASSRWAWARRRASP